MIVRNVGDRRPLKSLAAASVSALLLVVACETAPPTTVEEETPETFQWTEIVEEPNDAAGAPAGVVSPLGARLDAELLLGTARFFLDGEEHSEVPDDLTPEAIDRVEVRKTADGPSGVYVFTKQGVEPRGTIRLREQADKPVIYIDGKWIEEDFDLSTLNPESIERVEVMKGEAAASLYGPEASGGVIQITSKEGAVVRK